MKKLILLTICLLCGLSALCQNRLEQGKQYYQWRDYGRALPLLQQAAKEGYGEACYLLGNMYYYGYGTEKNYSIAMRMYQRGLEFGYNYGNAELGRMYENGEGCTQDLEKAFSFYSKSKSVGDKLGMYLLALCYVDGTGTDRDFEQAYALFSSLYKDSYFKSEYKWAYQWTCSYLGQLHEIGLGTDVDLDKAIEYYINSEKPDRLYRASQLAKLYSLKEHDWQYLLRSAVWKGIDDGKALYEFVQLELKKWNGKISDTTFDYLVKAAETYPPALKLLGDCYRLGHGTAVNMVKAREYYDRAEANREAIAEIEEKERQEEQRIAAEKQAEKDRIEQEKREAAMQLAERKRQARLAAASRYKEGDLYQEDGKGVVVKHSGQSVLIIAMSDSFGSWPGYYANCDEGWRLPTRQELSYIQSNKDLINKHLRDNGGSMIRSGVYYWSASQGYSKNERIASNGSEISRDQSNRNYIRLVREY